MALGYPPDEGSGSAEHPSLATSPDLGQTFAPISSKVLRERRVESEVSRVQLSHDPRSQHDDPLLDSLLNLCVLHQKPASRAMLTTGLPLPSQRMTPELLPRAAARAGL